MAHNIKLLLESSCCRLSAPGMFSKSVGVARCRCRFDSTHARQAPNDILDSTPVDRNPKLYYSGSLVSTGRVRPLDQYGNIFGLSAHLLSNPHQAEVRQCRIPPNLRNRSLSHNGVRVPTARPHTDVNDSFTAVEPEGIYIYFEYMFIPSGGTALMHPGCRQVSNFLERKA